MTASLDDRLARVEALVRAIEALPDAATREHARELARVLMDVHAAALARMLDTAAATVVDAWAGDELVASVLLLHGLHPRPLAERVAAALESVRPTLRAHRGDVELVGVVDGEVCIRLTGTCDGCPSSAATLHGAIEEALDRLAPDRAGLRVVGARAASGREAPGACVGQEAAR